MAARLQGRRRRYDVCNGDADGLCAAVQWRLHAPGAATLITGLKREIELLQYVPLAHASQVNVFDLSMLRNQAALADLLAAGVRVRWFDHHAAPRLPRSALLEAHLQHGAQWCTSLLVDQALAGRFGAWAVVGAFGDNLVQAAQVRAQQHGLSPAQQTALRRMGVLLNYNAYGESLADLCVAPAALYESMRRYADPKRWAASTPFLDQIAQQHAADHRQARAVQPVWSGARVRVIVLPDAAWAARVMGSLANERANQEPDCAHAVLKLHAQTQTYRVSVRAPSRSPRGADTLCEQFGGLGRAAAAGIDQLPCQALPALIAAMDQAW